MKEFKEYMIEYENYSEIIAEMVSELINEVGYEYNYQMVELEQIERVFKEYYNKLKDNSELAKTYLSGLKR